MPTIANEFSNKPVSRFKDEILTAIVDGKLTTNIHKVSSFYVSSSMLVTKIVQVYPWTDIQEAHREMENDKNMYESLLFHIRIYFNHQITPSGKIIVEVV